MTPEARATTEIRAERCVRRGEWSEALALFEQLARAFPGDPTIERKLTQVRENVAPEELQRAALAARQPRAEDLPAGQSPEAEGERLFAIGDYAGAAAAYRRALKEKPHSELIRERLVELFQLAQVAPRRASPTDAVLPVDPEDKLRALLDRIASRKRVGV